jgi:hypothetical protein
MLLAALEVGMKNMFLCAAVVVLSCGFAYGQAQYKVLYTFAGGATGGNPVGDLVFDHSGNLIWNDTEWWKFRLTGLHPRLWNSV